jgi:hypothetical protein
MSDFQEPGENVFKSNYSVQRDVKWQKLEAKGII